MAINDMHDYRYVVEQFEPGDYPFLNYLRFMEGDDIKHAVWIMRPEYGGSPIHRVRVVDDYESVSEATDGD